MDRNYRLKCMSGTTPKQSTSSNVNIYIGLGLAWLPLIDCLSLVTGSWNTHFESRVRVLASMY
ncbi:hypothetical protein BJX99DRAFT_233001 [Aspergillus californicus]